MPNPTKEQLKEKVRVLKAEIEQLKSEKETTVAETKAFEKPRLRFMGGKAKELL